MPLSTKIQFVLPLYAFCSHGLIKTTWEDDIISYKQQFSKNWMAQPPTIGFPMKKGFLTQILTDTTVGGFSGFKPLFLFTPICGDDDPTLGSQQSL